MKSGYDPVTGRSPGDEPDDAWESMVDKTVTMHAWVCLICHAALAKGQSGHAKQHVEWHRGINGR